MKKRTKEITKIFGEVLGAVLALSLAFSTNVYATSDDIVSDAQIEDLMNTDTINEISDKVDDIGEQISNLSDAASENDSSEDEDSDSQHKRAWGIGKSPVHLQRRGHVPYHFRSPQGKSR